ncbi:NAD(P)-dependent oxidoreductase [Microbispora sp. KK1-11]|uniref:NAD(P)-dependent oxidoreductase n=1 Tax=Microbispora sp. KK1-11 TaxID=2053005 RepID=UPI0011572C02|nr:NAD(P)H-binding protein [Microbispora sp. KK1-11]TQS28089.1 NAD-dependent epimerase/dehydratase family protein [Microbispora sp. KK1-11]
MRITVFGATGNVGRRVVAEAVSRGHEVTGVARNPVRLAGLPGEARARVGDATDVNDVVALTAEQDLVITATCPAPGDESQLVTVATTLLAACAKTGARLLLVGGAGSLTVEGGGRLMDRAGYPSFLQPIAAACVEQLAACRANTIVDWAYLSPADLLVPGERTGLYRVGGDELVVDADGESRISMEDLAVALLDEAERPRHHRARFTVAY